MPVKIKKGLCGCGCGNRTSIARKTNKKWGHSKGQPVRYIKGHGGRGKKRPAHVYRATKRQSSAFMTREQIFAAHLVYAQRGLTIRQLADLLWEKFGYANRESCERNLTRSFHSYALPVYGGRARRSNWISCAQCGGPMNERTPGCSTCTRRHWVRKKREKRHSGIV